MYILHTITDDFNIATSQYEVDFSVYIFSNIQDLEFMIETILSDRANSKIILKTKNKISLKGKNGVLTLHFDKLDKYLKTP